jgi:sortase A
VSASPAILKLPAARTARSLRIPLVITAVAIGVALIVSYIGTNVFASLAQRDLGRRMDALLERAAAMDPLQRSSISYAPGDPVARLQVSSIGLDVVVAEGATAAAMRRAPGHLAGSAVPGEEGVAIVTGNRFGFGSYFLRLDRLEVGDRILTQSALGSTTYTVIEVRVVPADRLDLATDSSERVLVLFGSSRLWGGADRVVVRAVAEDA